MSTTTDIDITSPAAAAQQADPPPRRARWRRPLVIGAAATAALTGVLAIRAATAESPTPPAPAVVSEDDPWCVAHRPC
jgi:hypothetical protein